MTLNEIKVRAEKVEQVLNGNTKYNYTVKLNDWQKGDKHRVYISVIEKCEGTRHYAKKDYGYFDVISGEYVSGERDLFEVYDFQGSSNSELEIAEETAETAGETAETAKPESEIKTAVVNALNTAAVEDAKLYREKGMPEDKIAKATNAVKAVAEIIRETETSAVEYFFAEINPNGEVKEIGQKIFSAIKLNVPYSDAQKAMKEKILTTLNAAR